MKTFWCSCCYATFRFSNCIKIICPNCKQAELTEHFEFGSEDNVPYLPQVNVNVNTPELASASTVDSGALLDEEYPSPIDPLPILHRGIYYWSSKSLAEGQKYHEKQPFHTRFSIPPGQTFLRLIYEGCRRQLSDLEFQNILRLYRTLYYEEMVEERHKTEIKYYPLSFVGLTECRARLAEFLVQVTYYQYKFRSNVNIQRPLTEKELGKWTVSTVSLQQLEQGQRCSLCSSGFRLHEKFCQIDCGHLIHAECLTRWVRRCGMCPECNFNLT